MDIEEHKKAFDMIIQKYGLAEDKKAEKISNYITKHPEGKIHAKEFAEIFEMDEKEAMMFLSYIMKGIQFKENHIDNK